VLNGHHRRDMFAFAREVSSMLILAAFTSVVKAIDAVYGV
jgi:hypothetical protein